MEDNCARMLENLLPMCCFGIMTHFKPSRFAPTGNCVFCERRVFHQRRYLIRFGKMDLGSVHFGMGKGLVLLHFKAWGSGGEVVNILGQIF